MTCLGLCKRSVWRQQTSGESRQGSCEEQAQRRRDWSTQKAWGAASSSCPTQPQGAVGGMGEAAAVSVETRREKPGIQSKDEAETVRLRSLNERFPPSTPPSPKHCFFSPSQYLTSPPLQKLRMFLSGEQWARRIPKGLGSSASRTAAVPKPLVQANVQNENNKIHCYR